MIKIDIKIDIISNNIPNINESLIGKLEKENITSTAEFTLLKKPHFEYPAFLSGLSKNINHDHIRKRLEKQKFYSLN